MDIRRLSRKSNRQAALDSTPLVALALIAVELGVVAVLIAVLMPWLLP
jgi:predicted DNA-binding protein (UPF0278 family)